MTDITALVTKMTIEEKISLLAGVDLWHTAAVPRLGIPAIKVTDGPNGARGAWSDLGPTSALFPVGTALGATWNTELIEHAGEELAREVRAKGAHVLLGPTVNIHRTPLAGRNFECFSEDPYLSGKMAAAYIRGVQKNGIAACIKHFVCNDQEFQRMTISAEVDERTLHEIYLEPFRRAIAEASPWTLMSSYNRVNGVYASENPALLEGLLKDEWKFDGLVMSDWKGTYSERVPVNGLDLEMPGPARWMEAKVVLQALESGELTSAELDDKVCRVLKLTERVHAFEKTGQQDEQAEDTPGQRALIRTLAQETIVLLKNEGGLLPIDTGKVRKIAVIGELAARPNVMGGGSSRVSPHYVISPLEGILGRAGEDIAVVYAGGCLASRNVPVLEAGDRRSLTLKLYDNVELTGSPAYEKAVRRAYFDWWGPCVPNVDQGRFSARLTGELEIGESGNHKFSLGSAGKSRLFVNGELAINNWDASTEPTQKTIEMTLTAGKVAQLQVDFLWQGQDDWRFLRVGHLPPQAKDPITEAVEIAREADVAIVVAGLTSEWESESFDRRDMDLPGKQDELIERIVRANPNTIVVLNTGSPVSMPWAEQVPVIVEQWYNSQECGNALADVLFGDVNPSGKLPTTFPLRYEDNPTLPYYPGRDGKAHYDEGLFVGYRHYDSRGVEPLFPFGHGLSYTTFELGELKTSAPTFRESEGLDLEVKVRNTGERAGKEVLQVYVHDVESSLERPEQELKAFEKVELQAGETKTVQFHLGREAFWYYDAARHGWTVEPGEFEIRVGNSSRARSLRTRVTLLP